MLNGYLKKSQENAILDMKVKIRLQKSQNIITILYPLIAMS